MQLYIGLMSGTSMDGIDAGLIEISDEKSIKELGGISISYDLDFKKLLKSAELAVRDNNGDLKKAKLENIHFLLISTYHQLKAYKILIDYQILPLMKY